MVVHERLHDDVGIRPTVVYVANDVEPLDGKSLDKLAQRLDELSTAVSANDRVDDGRIVRLLVLAVTVFGHELFDDVGEVVRQRFAYAGARVLPRGAFAYGHETRQHDGIPCPRIAHLR